MKKKKSDGREIIYGIVFLIIILLCVVFFYGNNIINFITNTNNVINKGINSVTSFFKEALRVILVIARIFLYVIVIGVVIMAIVEIVKAVNKRKNDNNY